MKYLFLLVVVFLLWTSWQKRARRDAQPPSPSAERQPEQMIACRHCGLVVPVSESAGEGDDRYCCEAHRRAGADRRQ